MNNLKNKDEIESIYNLYVNDVYKFLRFFTGSENEAEDLTQEVFIQVIRSFENYKHKGTMKTWILTIARNTAISNYRKKRFTYFLPFKKELGTEDRLPEMEYDQKELKQVIQHELLKLKPQYRMVVILRCLKDLSIKETADVLGWSESKVKTTYHRALNMLRIDALRKEWMGDEENECS